MPMNDSHFDLKYTDKHFLTFPSYSCKLIALVEENLLNMGLFCLAFDLLLKFIH